jgi:ribosome-binding protein aMBF1 (putative translation factor)
MAEPGAAESYAAARREYELGCAVRELRERRGWSQAQLAEATGLAEQAVVRFEAGGTTLAPHVLQRLESMLGPLARGGAGS